MRAMGGVTRAAVPWEGAAVLVLPACSKTLDLQGFVFHPFKLNVSAFTSNKVIVILAVVALKKHNVAVAFVSEDVRRHSVEKPAVVRNDQRVTGKRLDGLLKGAQRFN